MKKGLSLVLALILALAFTACGGNDTPAAPASVPSEPASVAEETSEPASEPEED